MFYLYPSVTASMPMASFPTLAQARATGARWFVGGGIVRSTPSFNFYKG